MDTFLQIVEGGGATLLQGEGTAGTLHCVMCLTFTSFCLDYMKKFKEILQLNLYKLLFMP
jgi:hypothetical protein